MKTPNCFYVICSQKVCDVTHGLMLPPPVMDCDVPSTLLPFLNHDILYEVTLLSAPNYEVDSLGRSVYALWTSDLCRQITPEGAL